MTTQIDTRSRSFTRHEMTRRDIWALEQVAAKMNKRIERINAKLAEEAKLPPVRVRRGEASHIWRPNHNGVEMRVRVWQVRVSCPTISHLCLPGYTLLALLQRADEQPLTAEDQCRLITRVADDQTDLTHYRHGAPTCDECQKALRRKTLFLVRSPEGDVRAYGGTCVEMFVPKSAQQALSMLEAVRYMETGGWGDLDEERQARFVPTWHADEILAASIVWLSRHAYVRSQQDGATKDIIGTVLSYDPPRGKHEKAIMEEYREIRAEWSNERLEQRLAAVRGWIEQGRGSHNDYAANLAACLDADYAVEKSFGLLCSAPSSFERAEARAHEQRQQPTTQPEQPAEQHTDGDRITLGAGEVVFDRWISGHFGDSKMLKFRVEGDPRCYVTFTTGRNSRAERGDRFTRLCGTVKRTQDYRGEAQTVLTRCTADWIGWG